MLVGISAHFGVWAAVDSRPGHGVCAGYRGEVLRVAVSYPVTPARLTLEATSEWITGIFEHGTEF